jgi:mannose-6-phosphate isomerase-like protein (cupin superfamily)
MQVEHFTVAAGACACLLFAGLSPVGPPVSRTSQATSLIEHDSTVATRQPGPHRGGGETTAYPFFSRAPDLHLVFRKRALHRGAAIGYHRQEEDEVYYVLSGTGELTLNGERFIVGPGTAILTRPGSSHSLRQIGSDDLVIIIAYQQARGAEGR